MSGRPVRPRTSGDLDGTVWELFDAGRTGSGLGLGYFIREDRAEGDRLVELPSGTSVEALAPDAVADLLAASVPLTPTELRVVAGDGSIWLAQAFGPVWAEGGGAAGTTGARLRCVSEDRGVLEIAGQAAAAAYESELIEAVDASILGADEAD